MAKTPDKPTRTFFSAPAPIRALFRHFPLAQYPAEALPARSSPLLHDDDDDVPRLYVFSHHDDAARGRPSYNPSCLKWQTILRIANVNVHLVPSSNHASPSGALPFLLLLPPSSPSSSDSPHTTQQQPQPRLLTGEKIAAHAIQHAPAANLDDPSPRIDTYQALIAHSIRPAWLHALYLNPSNDPLLTSLYLPSSPSLLLPRLFLRRSLRLAAADEILRLTHRPLASAPDDDDIYAAAHRAFAALDAVLHHHHHHHPDQDTDPDSTWLLGAKTPGVLDADLFSYTHLLVGRQLAWSDRRLADSLAAFPNLVRHAQRLYRRCWGDEDET